MFLITIQQLTHETQLIQNKNKTSPNPKRGSSRRLSLNKRMKKARSYKRNFSNVITADEQPYAEGQISMFKLDEELQEAPNRRLISRVASTIFIQSLMISLRVSILSRIYNLNLINIISSSNTGNLRLFLGLMRLLLCCCQVLS